MGIDFPLGNLPNRVIILIHRFLLELCSLTARDTDISAMAAGTSFSQYTLGEIYLIASTGIDSLINGLYLWPWTMPPTACFKNSTFTRESQLMAQNCCKTVTT
jgi:hypothetical protein